jgi:hypothetical protein
VVRSTISELTDTTPRWSVQAVRAGEAAGCRLVWLLSSCVQPPAAPQCGDPSSSTSCACDQAARLISGFHKGRLPARALDLMAVGSNPAELSCARSEKLS